MSLNSKARRRIFGSVCLGLALLMLIVGETLLQGRLSPVAFILYWLGCLIFTGLAIFAALLDAVRVRAESLDIQRSLIEETVREIQQEKSRRASDAPKKSNSSN